MKRKHKEPEYSFVHSCYPLFYRKQCCMCKQQFRLEKGWRFKVYQIDVYICCICAPSRKDAEKIEKEELWIREY